MRGGDELWDGSRVCFDVTECNLTHEEKHADKKSRTNHRDLDIKFNALTNLKFLKKYHRFL